MKTGVVNVCDALLPTEKLNKRQVLTYTCFRLSVCYWLARVLLTGVNVAWEFIYTSQKPPLQISDKKSEQICQQKLTIKYKTCLSIEK